MKPTLNPIKSSIYGRALCEQHGEQQRRQHRHSDVHFRAEYDQNAGSLRWLWSVQPMGTGGREHLQYLQETDLVGGFKHGFYFPFHIWDVILPIDWNDAGCYWTWPYSLTGWWWLEHGWITKPLIYGNFIIIPTDFHIFQRGRSTSIIYGMSSFPLTHIFQDGYCTTNQDGFHCFHSQTLQVLSCNQVDALVIWWTALDLCRI